MALFRASTSIANNFCPLKAALEAYTIIRKIAQVFFLVIVSSCSVISEHRDWNFIKDVGGLNIGGQDKNPGWLIIRGDVSGLKEFSHKPNLVNSALAVKEVAKEISDSTIKIYVVTTVISDTYKSSEISGVDISGIEKGTYKVEYLNPNGESVFLSEVEIN